MSSYSLKNSKYVLWKCVLAQWTFFRCSSSATKLTLLESKITCFDETRFSWRCLKFRLHVWITVNSQDFVMISGLYDFYCVTTKKTRSQIHKTTSTSEIGVVYFWPIQWWKKPMHPIFIINQSATSWFIQYSQCISQIVIHRSKNTSMMLFNLSPYRCTDTIQSMVVNFFLSIDWLIDLTWALLPAPVHNRELIVGFLLLEWTLASWIRYPLESLLITLSTARCLYQVQWIPSTLYDSLYVLTLSSLLYRPCVATLVTAVISPRLICNHWLELLIFGHQAAICLPSVKRLSLASEGPCRLS